jgi:hypothetical protein
MVLAEMVLAGTTVRALGLGLKLAVVSGWDTRGGPCPAVRIREGGR